MIFFSIKLDVKEKQMEKRVRVIAYVKVKKEKEFQRLSRNFRIMNGKWGKGGVMVM